MGIIGYQIVIALIIIIASFFGRSALGIVVFLAIIWTVTHVFVPWLMAMTLKIGLYVLFAAAGIARTFDAPSWRPGVLPTAVLVGVLGGWMYPGARMLSTYLTGVWPGYAVTMNLLLPTALLALSLVLGRKSPPRGARQAEETQE